MTTTLCDSGSVKILAGENVDTSLTDAQYTILINNAEAVLSMNAKYDLVTNYASLPTNMKPFLTDACAALAAVGAINFNMSNYTSRTEAQTMLDVNYSKVVEAINLLRDDKFREFLKRGTQS